LFAAGGIFCYSAARSGLGGLSAGVGIDFGVEDQDVYVCAGAQNVVETACADVVGPAVAAYEPDALADQGIRDAE
jgi:hypothetical protein